MAMNGWNEMIYGTSVEGRPLVLLHTGENPQPGSAWFIGGLHGDEPATIALLERWMARGPVDGACVIPCANPDGLLRKTRYNARGVDLNRNFPHRWSTASFEPPGTHPFSESESAALRDIIAKLAPGAVVSLHWALAEVEADGRAGNPLAQSMWDALDETQRRPYRLRLAEASSGSGDDFCPGSLGQWCGHLLGIPMVTLELPYAPEEPRPNDPLSADHWKTVQTRWSTDSEGYLRAVEPAVSAMLDAARRAISDAAGDKPKNCDGKSF